MLSSFACLACLSRFHKEVTRSYAQPGPSTGRETCWGREREEENARRESEKNSHRPLSIGERDYDVFRQEARMMIAENSEQMKTAEIVALFDNLKTEFNPIFSATDTFLLCKSMVGPLSFCSERKTARQIAFCSLNKLLTH